MAKQLYVSSLSVYNDFLLVGIIKGVVSDKWEEDSVQDSPNPTRNLNVNFGRFDSGQLSWAKIPW